MSSHVVALPPIPTVPVAGGGLFPVRRIFCVGRNYAEHAREMGSDPDREPPFFFAKPADAVLTEGRDMPYPSRTASLHYEIELVAAIGTGGADIAVEAAAGHVYGYAVGLDMTRRDLQNEAKKSGRPWDMGKGFDHSAPIGTIHPVAEIGHPGAGAITLEVGGTVRQSGDIAEMIWNVPEVIAHLSTLVRLEPGDLIFTGTPAGVGAVVAGDHLVGRVDGVGTVETTIR
jgi:fumarylpyruvate hydrolase